LRGQGADDKLAAPRALSGRLRLPKPGGKVFLGCTLDHVDR
jgi:hypothetical protein